MRVLQNEGYEVHALDLLGQKDALRSQKPFLAEKKMVVHQYDSLG